MKTHDLLAALDSETFEELVDSLSLAELEKLEVMASLPTIQAVVDAANIWRDGVWFKDFYQGDGSGLTVIVYNPGASAGSSHEAEKHFEEVVTIKVSKTLNQEFQIPEYKVLEHKDWTRLTDSPVQLKHEYVLINHDGHIAN